MTSRRNLAHEVLWRGRHCAVTARQDEDGRLVATHPNPACPVDLRLRQIGQHDEALVGRRVLVAIGDRIVDGRLQATVIDGPTREA